MVLLKFSEWNFERYLRYLFYYSRFSDVTVITSALLCHSAYVIVDGKVITRSSAIAEGPRVASCQLKSCQLPRSSAETTYTTSPDRIDDMKLEI